MSNENDSRPEDAAHDEKPKLKVTDRRMFDADGNPRQPDADRDEISSDAPAPSAASPIEEAPQIEAAPEAAPKPEEAPAKEGPESAPIDAQDSPPSAAEASASQPTTSEPTTGGDPTPAGSYADLPRGFAAFVESQYLEALIFLGAVPHPQTGETIEDPEFARYKIDLLTMIQEKTEGNLSDEEAKLIEDVLYQLRMLFVQKTSPVAP